MNRIGAWLKQTIKMFVIAGIVFAVLRYFGGFSDKQSLILTLLLCAIYDFLIETRKATQQNFEPYRLSIEPKWRDLLRDYNLVKDDEWDSVSTQLKAVPESRYNVLRNGFQFTFLKPQPFDGLIYRDDRKYFRAELDFRERIEEIEIPRGHARGFFAYCLCQMGA